MDKNKLRKEVRRILAESTSSQKDTLTYILGSLEFKNDILNAYII